MTKANLGMKRICPHCGARFYDLGQNPAKCPKCGAMHDSTAPVKARRSRAKAAPEVAPAKGENKPKPKKPIKEIEDVNIEEFEGLETLEGEEEIEEIEEMEDIDSLEELEEIEEAGPEEEGDEELLIEGDEAEDGALIDAIDDEEEEEADEAEPAPPKSKPKAAKPKGRK